MTLACSYYNGSNSQPSLLNASTHMVVSSRVKFISLPLTKSISEEKKNWVLFLWLSNRHVGLLYHGAHTKNNRAPEGSILQGKKGSNNDSRNYPGKLF